MSWRWLFLVGAPLGFGYFLSKAAAAADAVDLDLFSAFVYLLMAVPLGLGVAAAYSSAIAEWIGESVWMRHPESPGHDHPHWLAASTGWLEQQGWRWLCFLAVWFRCFSAWSILHQRGLRAVRKGGRLERFFARRLYRLDNALDALRAAEVLVRHGIEPPPHSDAQVQLFIRRAGLPGRPAVKPGGAQMPVEVAVAEQAQVADTFGPGALDPVSNPVLGVAALRNPAIALFEGAETKGPQWNSHECRPEAGLRQPAEARRETTVFFSPPPAPLIAFRPVRFG